MEIPGTIAAIGDHSLRGNLDENPIDHPLVAQHRFVAALERIGAEIKQLWYTQVREPTPPNAYALVVLLFEDDLPVANELSS